MPRRRSRWPAFELERALQWFGRLAALALVVAWVHLGWVSVAGAASESLRVRVQRPLEDDALIDEVVNRVIGELGALGFDVEVLRRRTSPTDVDRPRQLDPDTEGALAFARDGSVVVVSVWAANSEHAFVQRFETGAGGSGADVIAVDAVEALRGVLIEPGARPAEPATKPEASVPKMPPKSSPAEPVEPTPGAGESRPITPFEIPWAHSFSAVLRAAPNVGLEAQGRGTVGLGASLAFGYDAVSIGIGVDRTLLVEAVEAEAGSADIERTTGFALVRGKLALDEHWDGFSQLSVGVARYRVNARAEAGYVATGGEDSVFVVGFGAGVAHWPFTHFGWFGALEGWVLPKPIEVQMAERGVAKLGAPAVLLSVGVAGRVR